MYYIYRIVSGRKKLYIYRNKKEYKEREKNG